MLLEEAGAEGKKMLLLKLRCIILFIFEILIMELNWQIQFSQAELGL